VNGRLVLQPILFHFFDSAFGRTVCPEKERHGFREITRIKPELRSCRRRREDETTPECARPRALQLGSLQTTEHFPTACPSHVAAGDGRTPLTQKFHFGIRDQIGENPCNPCQEFLVPALQRGGLSYLPAMQRLKGIFGTAMVLVIFAGGVWLGFTVPRWMKLGSGLHMENTATVVEQVQTLSDLVTVKYVLEKVVILEDVKWYGENRVLLLAHGVVKAGIDLKRITPDDVTITGKIIRLRLPPPQIMDAYLDDKNSQVIDHATGLLRAFDKYLQQIARANAVDDIRRAARTDGILDEADKRARLELELFLRQAGFEQVEFR